MNKIIEVTVFPTGETKLETRGFTGGQCKEASRSIEQALGIATQEKLTTEFYQTVQTKPELREGQV
jgi:hypothetical protein